MEQIGGSTGGSSQSLNGATYPRTTGPNGGDPYTHNLLVHRYGIKNRGAIRHLLGRSPMTKINSGWEAKSYLDVRY